MKATKKSSKRLPLTALIFLSFFSLWILFAFGSVIFNLAKTIPEEKTWGHLTDSQKKYLIFGDIYSFLIFIKDNTPQTASIIVYPHTEELFYRGIYELYPRKMTTALTGKLVKDVQTIKPEFIATYNTVITLTGYQKIATFSGKQHTFGALYKRI